MKKIACAIVAGFFVFNQASVLPEDLAPAPSVTVRPALPQQDFLKPEIRGEVKPAFPEVVPEEPPPQIPMGRPAIQLLFPKYLMPFAKAHRPMMMSDIPRPPTGDFIGMPIAHLSVANGRIW